MVRLIPLLLLMVSLLACSALYYPEPISGMAITETLYTDAQKIAEVCGEALACAFVVGNSCHIHLPLAANGDVLHRDHEITECYGRIDTPQTHNI